MEERHLVVSLLDPDKFVKVNNLEEVTNPVFFIRDGAPTDDGLLSNKIFGIVKADRANTFAYIDLAEYFMNPLCYKIWSRMDNKVRDVIHGNKYVKIDSHGYLVEDENGSTGMKFLKDNIDKIRFKTTESNKRDRNIDFLMKNKDKMFIKKMPVIPAFYRDVDTGKGRMGVGEINQMYSSLIVSVKALKESIDYGLTMSYATRGRIQEIILNIYNWLTDEPQLSKKFGSLRRAVYGKTTDYGSRLVITAPDLKVESLEDLEIDLDHTAVPLASICANFYPFMIFWVKRFFENEFSGSNMYNYIDANGKASYITVKDYQIEFSEERIKKEMDRFIHGFSNRFISIEIPNKENKPIFMKFKGTKKSAEEYAKGTEGEFPIVERELTWCDIFYQAAVEVTRDKMVMITRYPIKY